MKWRKRGRFLQSIRGKIFLMGTTAAAALLILGITGAVSLNRNNSNNEVLTQMNHVHLCQYENQGLDASYLYFLDDSYLEAIVENFGRMEDYIKQADAASEGRFREEIQNMAQETAECRENYDSLRELCGARGYTLETGGYQKFVKQDGQMEEQFQEVADDRSWLDGKWMEIGSRVEQVSENGRTFYKYTYEGELPSLGKRDQFLVRVGATAVDYQGMIAVNRIMFHKGKQKKYVDITQITEEDLAGSYGTAAGKIERRDFQNEPSIATKGTFQSVNNSWEEIAIKFPLEGYEIQNYDRVTFDVYLESGTFADLTVTYALTDKYDFNKALKHINESFAEYSRNVVEGKDVSAQAGEIREVFETISRNLELYVGDKEKKKDLSSLVSGKEQAFSEMALQDQRVLELKQENIRLSKQLTEQTGNVRQSVEHAAAGAQRGMIAIIVIVLAVSFALLSLITLAVAKSISRNIHIFQDTLSGISQGNLAVRADIRSRDEFAVFGQLVNSFLDKMADVLKKVQAVSGEVRMSGEALDDMALRSGKAAAGISSAVSEISAGAVTQAGETETAAEKIEEMGRSFRLITDYVSCLGNAADQMHEASMESARLMQELQAANETTVKAFSQVSGHTHTTNNFAQKIREAAELITSIASQTNLLSLNASIEAARAGDAGKGFAVVAMEIQKLAEQSSGSAEIISRIISELTAQADTTVKIVDEVSGVMELQQQKLQLTQERFDVLEAGIGQSADETKKIQEQTGCCAVARKEVEEVIAGLSSISEENAAAAENTTSSMTELTEMMECMSLSSGNLKEIAMQLENDLKFFQL